ncbi:MAG TPA: hypothetical protein VH062_32105 [Polyangiaceae bacterium]|jgi:hypothetical protein|nr:hypothetical protein [Polyangiaceae bacterium]
MLDEMTVGKNGSVVLVFVTLTQVGTSISVSPLKTSHGPVTSTTLPIETPGEVCHVKMKMPVWAARLLDWT